jgi:hypothetical protein
MNKVLDELVQESTKRVEDEKWDYYYQVGDYKFNNVYLAQWFEKETNSWAAFVARRHDQLKKTLLNQTVDLNVDYTARTLRKLRQQHKILRLCFSGGGDCLTLLDIASKNNVWIDELLTVVTGDNLDLDENKEITKLAIPNASRYTHCFGKHVLHMPGRIAEKNAYKDPYILYKKPEVGPSMPIFRRMWDTEGRYQDGVNVIGPDKPQLLHYKDRWYTLCFDTWMNGSYALKNTFYMNADSEHNSIMANLKESILYRNYLYDHSMVKNGTNFYRLNERKNVEILGRIQTDNVNVSHPKGTAEDIWNSKDIAAISSLVKDNDLETLLDYFSAIKCFIDTQPYFNYNEKIKNGHSKFCWAIDIDSLEVYTQSELLPNGFEE